MYYIQHIFTTYINSEVPRNKFFRSGTTREQ